MSDFGFRPAFPMPAVYDPGHESIEAAASYGFDAGLNIQQHVWLTLYAARIAAGEMSVDARNAADNGLLAVVKRLEELA